MATILFADDNKGIGESCKQELEDAGYRVILARDAGEAVSLVKEQLPDLVVLDLCMLEQDGLDAIEPIKAIAPQLPIIVFTANDRDCFRDVRCRSAEACVKKSGDLAGLRRAIAGALASGGGNGAARSARASTQLPAGPVSPPVAESAENEGATADFTAPFMVNTTAPVAVNAAFLQEIKEHNLELRRLLADIQGALAGPGSLRGQWKRFVELLGEFRDGLAMHFGLEETYGYFENPAYVAPRLSRNAQTLRTQHQRLYSEICAICEQAEQRLYREAQAGAARKTVQRFVAFCDQLREHEGREDDLIFRTFTEGIAGRDPGAVVR